MIFMKCFIKLIIILNQLVSVFAQTNFSTTISILSTAITNSTFGDNFTNSSEDKIFDKKSVYNYEIINITTSDHQDFNLTTSILVTLPKPLFYLTEFKLINIKFNKTENEFIVDYLTSSNQTEFYQNDQEFTIDINCTSKDNQTWLHRKNNVFSTKSQDSVILSPLYKQSLPKPGAFIRCFSIAQSQNNQLDDSIFFLVGKSSSIKLLVKNIL